MAKKPLADLNIIAQNKLNYLYPVLWYLRG